MTISKKTGKILPGLRGSKKASGAVREGGERANIRAPKPAVKQMKSFRLTAEKIRRARKVLGTTTDTGTIEAALDMVVFRQELLDGLEAMAGVELIAPDAMDATRR